MRKFVLWFVLALVAGQASADGVILPSGVVRPVFFDKQGIVVLAYKKGPGGLNVWDVQRGATKTVFYTTPDNKVLVSGVLWDAASGANLSDVFISQDMADAVNAAPAAASAAGDTPTGHFSHDATSDAIASVAALPGVKEGKASIDKTLYIIFDPRCPHCHAVYQATRDFVRHGGSIKWIPTTVLGDKQGGAALVAAILEAPNKVTALQATMGATSGGKTPSALTMKAISENESYFFAAFERNRGAGEPGVPVAFFETQSGEPQMVGSIDDPVLLPKILHDVKH